MGVWCANLLIFKFKQSQWLKYKKHKLMIKLLTKTIYARQAQQTDSWSRFVLFTIHTIFLFKTVKYQIHTMCFPMQSVQITFVYASLSVSHDDMKRGCSSDCCWWFEIINLQTLLLFIAIFRISRIS